MACVSGELMLFDKVVKTGSVLAVNGFARDVAIRWISVVVGSNFHFLFGSTPL
jgi:hypothetical protein